MILNIISCDRYASDRVVFWYLVHNVEHEFLDDRT